MTEGNLPGSAPAQVMSWKDPTVDPEACFFPVIVEGRLLVNTAEALGLISDSIMVAVVE